jgi:hypothetical protein
MNFCIKINRIFPKQFEIMTGRGCGVPCFGQSRRPLVTQTIYKTSRRMAILSTRLPAPTA